MKLKKSRKQLLRARNRSDEAAWQAYVTLLRLPISIRLKIQNILIECRDSLAASVDESEEKIQNKAEELAVKLGGLI